MGYSLETAKKDLQVHRCKRDFSTLGGYRSINSGTVSGFWKETFSLHPVCFSYTSGSQSGYPVRNFTQTDLPNWL
jgi:hypothetical protein